MKTIIRILLIGIILKTTSAYSQIPVNFNDCKYELFFVNAEEQPAWKIDSISSVEYFNKYFNEKENLANVNGKVILGVIIDEKGKPCCSSFSNLTKSNLDPELFKNAVNNMPEWKPAKQKNKEIVFLLHLVLNIENGTFVEKKNVP